jgi:Fe2+ or Zn2+ uptake regulation protein
LPSGTGQASKVAGDLDTALGRIARKHGFVADHHRLDLVGTCAGRG